jgi:glycosyltransferase involved in cell wall biosynthesis
MPIEKPRVLHVIARYNIGGTARYLNNLFSKISSEAEMLLAVGHVQGYEIEDSSLEYVNFERIEHLGRKINPISDLRAYLELRRLVKSYKPQIIHSHTFKAGLLSRLMFFRIPKVHTFHGHLMGDPEFSRRALQVIINIERRLAKLTKRIITVGEQVTTDLISVGVGKPTQYISIASEGEKLTFLTREESRNLLGIDLNSPTVLWMARMAPVKNPGLALEVARLLPDINFLMAGGGELFEETKSKAPKNVLLLSWVEAAKVIPVADIFLSTSLNEGVPYSLVEVQSCGIPVVAVDVGSVSEVVTHGSTGFLTRPNPEELADAIVELLNNQSKRLEFSNAALEKAREKVANSDMGGSYIRVYQEVLSELSGK